MSLPNATLNIRKQQNKPSEIKKKFYLSTDTDSFEKKKKSPDFQKHSLK